MANFYVVPGGADTKDGTSWAKAFGFAELMTWCTNTANAGDICYIYSGTYTIDAAYATVRNGTGSAYIKLIGVSNQNTLALAQGTDRPLFTCNGNVNWIVNDYWWAESIIFSGNAGTAANIWRMDQSPIIKNCKIENTSATADKSAFQANTGMLVAEDCEFRCTNGYGLFVANGYVIGCYTHDCKRGIRADGSPLHFINCIVEACSTAGFWLVTAGNGRHLYFGITIDNCVKGIDALNVTGTTDIIIMRNCTISHNTIGMTKGTYPAAYDIDYCNWHENSTADVEAGIVKGIHDIAVDPEFTSGNDFSLQSTSDLINAGYTMKLGVG